MGWILGIDTSSAELSIGLLQDGKPFMACSRYMRNSHAEHITRIMEFILKSSGISAGDISHAGIAVGPGSFTGLRIGISFLKGFFLTRETPVLPVSSLECMAESFIYPNATVIAAMDARQNRVFCATFKKEKGSLIRLTDDEIIQLQTFSTRYKKDNTILFDTLGYSNCSALKSLEGRENIYPANEVSLQRGLACANIAACSVENHSVWKKSVDILPNYMQASYAEMKHTKNINTN